MEVKMKNELLDKISCKYILINVFSHLNKSTKLNLISKCKKIQLKLNIKIEDYKEYSELYSKIIIETKSNNKPIFRYINIKNENEKNNFKI